MSIYTYVASCRADACRKTYATAASHAAHRAAAQQDDDKARSEAITDILAHRKWRLPT